jgi:hypothetical protein
MSVLYAKRSQNSAVTSHSAAAESDNPKIVNRSPRTNDQTFVYMLHFLVSNLENNPRDMMVKNCPSSMGVAYVYDLRWYAHVPGLICIANLNLRPVNIIRRGG